MLLGAALACQRNSDDAIDKAVLKAMTDTQKLDSYTQDSFIPFDPVNKKTVGIVTAPDGSKHQYAKGAPQVIAALCNMQEKDDSDADANTYFSTVADLASKGTRALGVAHSTDEGKTWQLMGVLALLDPPRPDAKTTITESKKLGLDVKMVTGDDVAIGSEISRQLGLGQNLVVAQTVFGEQSDPNHLSMDSARAVEKADGFGRVFPEHKFEIVKALQQRGHIVAMTGDGVNDAPALKQADCGVAVSGATDAARSAAALILTAPGLSTIVNAITEARAIFNRITSYVYYRIAMTIDIMFVVVLSYLVFVVRTEGSFFRAPYPSSKLFFAIVGTQIIAILMCLFGILVPALPWQLVALVWVYVLVCTVVTDFLKLGYYGVMKRREEKSAQLTQAIADHPAAAS